ncbi:MAG: hypothetical protein JO367_01480, partial [Actinobacteria bacterium]|nr:hypothetical protein [Actinomycetota bacterium]
GAGRPATASPQLQAARATTAPSAAAPLDSSAASASATPAAAPATTRGTATAPSAAVPPASTAALPPADLPAAGVYAYVTSGSDSISIGSKHQYPAETFAVLQRGDGCNWQVDHHVVDQHVDHIKRCGRPGNLMRVADASRVTFFGQTDGLEYVCDPPVPMIGDDATCAAADGSAAKYHAAVIDRPVVNVGGVNRDAIHILLTVTMTGRARGHASNQLWLDAATGMILHQIRDVDTQAHAAFGDVRYTEHAEFVLESMTPRQ